MTDFDDIKQRASLPTRVLSLCLAGDVLAEIAELELAYEAAGPPANIGEVSPKRVIAEQIAAAQQRMRDDSVDFHLQAMSAREWIRFIALQPSRVDGEGEDVWQERFFPWTTELVSRCCTDPVLSVQQVTELVDLLHGRAWNQLSGACMDLNVGKVDVPNSVAASELTPTSEQT